MTTWIPVWVAVLSAVLAGVFAVRTKRWEVRAQRLLELERRAATSKSEVFEPLIAGLGDMWDRVGSEDATPEWFEENVMPKFKEFMKWVGIYGSDDLIWTMHRYMQAIYHDAPANVTMRLLTELTLALRRDLGNPDSKVTALDILGLRINDLYDDGVAPPWAAAPEPQLYKQEGWAPPWGKRFRFGTPLKP